jgi:CRP/FNR family transcriptional regulator
MIMAAQMELTMSRVENTAPDLRKLAVRGPNGARDEYTDYDIRYQSVCAHCCEDELAQLNAIKSYRDFEPGQEIVAAGEVNDLLGSVVDGVVSLSITMLDGRRQTVGLMFPSDFIGRPMRSVVPYDAIALTPVRLCLYARSSFERVLQNSPALENRLLAILLDELDAAHEWMLLLGRKTPREKIATFLMMLVRRAVKPKDRLPRGDFIIELPMTREAIADYLGTTMETVSRHLNSLHRAGVIDLVDARRIRVPDVLSLLDVAAEDADGGMID